MNKPLQLIGERFARLVVLQRSETSRHGQAYWLCQCDCGDQTTVSSRRLTSGNTRSCGCLRKEAVKSIRYRHGKTNTRVHKIWRGMLQRCGNGKDKDFKNYGGRGITVCKRWMKFENFYADMGDPPPNTTLDRKENSAGYSHKNCRWATRAIQATNTRTNKFITFNRTTKTITQWARKLGLSNSILTKRFKRGWSIDKSLTTKSLLPQDRERDSHGRMVSHHDSPAPLCNRTSQKLRKATTQRGKQHER
jgi:hypothetical protein